AVRAVVEPADAVPADGVVPRHLAAAGFEDVEDLGADARRADGVEQDLDLDALLRPRSERLGEDQADFSSPVNVGLDRDRRLRRPDRLEHAWIELVAVVEQLDRVALEKRRPARAGDRADEILGIDRELVVEAEPRRGGRWRDEIADEGHGAGADGPPPLRVRDQ